MAEQGLLVMGALLLALAAFAARRAIRTRALARSLSQMVPQRVADAERGLVQVRGRIRADEPLRGPVSHEPAAYYAYRIEDPAGRSGKPRRLAVGKRAAKMEVHDESGTARLEHVAATIRSPHATIRELGHVDAIPAEYAAFFEEAGIDPKHLPRFHALRLVEYRLAPGDEVFVTGSVRTDENAKVFYRNRRSPFVVSATADTGLIGGLKTESVLFSVLATLFAAFATLFLGVGLA